MTRPSDKDAINKPHPASKSTWSRRELLGMIGAGALACLHSGCTPGRDSSSRDGGLDGPIHFASLQDVARLIESGEYPSRRPASSSHQAKQINFCTTGFTKINRSFATATVTNKQKESNRFSSFFCFSWGETERYRLFYTVSNKKKERKKGRRYFLQSAK